MKILAALVLAGGYGFLRTAAIPKLVELVAGRPMCAHPVRLLHTSLGIAPTLVVANTQYAPQIRTALGDHPRDWIVEQGERCGTAGAVQRCLPALARSAPSARHVVVLYGDMPCWSADSIALLIEQHLASAAVLSMFSIAISPDCPEAVRRFGRILRDAQGNIVAVREPYEMTPGDLAAATQVNPSAWVFDLAWLTSELPHLTPHDKGDGFPPELWLPDLVPVAVARGKAVCVVPLTDPREALGVNTLAELDEVQAYLATRYSENGSSCSSGVRCNAPIASC